MTATVFYDSSAETATISATFQNAQGANTDPATVTCLVTDPGGHQVTHTYQGAAPADIVRNAVGIYQLTVACSPASPGADGLWGGVFTGTGTVSDVQPFTWRVLPLATSQLWYVGMEEMRDRLGISDDSDDYALQTAIAASADFINGYCGRHFNPVTETRTYQPHDIWVLDVDDIVPGAAITLAVDQDGDGVYEQSWVKDADYQLKLGPGSYNVNAAGGVPRPYRQVQATGSGKWFPFTWPFTRLDRVQIATTWGWTAVPWGVTEANRILAEDFFRMKDAPFGVAGQSDYGVTRVQSNPWLAELLRDYVLPRRKVGV